MKRNFSVYINRFGHFLISNKFYFIFLNKNFTLLYKSVISRSKGNSPPLFFFFTQSRISKLDKYLCKTGTGLYKYKAALSERGRWMKERKDKCTWGLALQPHLGLVYLLYLQTWHQTHFPQD